MAVGRVKILISLQNKKMRRVAVAGGTRVLGRYKPVGDYESNIVAADRHVTKVVGLFSSGYGGNPLPLADR